MLKKLFGAEKKNASELLKQLNISKLNAHYFTDYNHLTCLLEENNVQAPPLKKFIKEMKKEAFTPSYLLKCAVVTHYFLQHRSKTNQSLLSEFAAFLMQKCNQMIHFMNSSRTFTEGNEQKSFNLSTSTSQGQQFRMGKSYFLLKKIIRPYLAYIIKFAEVTQSQREKQENQIRICEVWKLINLLNLIHGFTSNFTLIGRYYIEEYGAFVVLLSQALSVDINSSYRSIENYVTLNERLICLYSDKKEEQIEAQQFCRVLQQIGSINEKFSQFYMGKYFYKYLEHIEQPQWIDINSKTFDRIFQGTKRQSYEPPTKKQTKQTKRIVFRCNDMNVL